MFDHKKWVKMVTISIASCENEIHMVETPFNEDSKIYFFSQGGPILGEGRPENLGKMVKNRETYYYAN